jgi:type VI protein secretion system component VasF
MTTQSAQPSTSIAAQIASETPAQRAAFYTSKAHSFAQRAQNSLTAAGRAYEEAQAAKYLRIAAFALSSQEVQAAPVLRLVPVTAPDMVRAPEVTRTPKRPRPEASTPRVRAMRRFWAASKSAGLDVGNAEGMKAALCKYLGLHPGFSRADLSAGAWAEATAGVEFGLLAW